MNAEATTAPTYGRKARTISVKDCGIRAALYYPEDGSPRRMCYKVWHNGALLFWGDDYRPGSSISEDSKASIVQLLAFIAVQPADTSSEYFAAYTPAQLAFADSYDAEKLGYFVSDWEERAAARRQKEAARQRATAARVARASQRTTDVARIHSGPRAIY